ncbi:hypothetical protein VNI00_008675 [Paramarasmius palmivorus]|uniref:Uncharacterized protein n=1 Tax=Paramarasmius palmivorus TaxID=297713 RepID=A0AAW0CVS4_9AGAR
MLLRSSRTKQREVLTGHSGSSLKKNGPSASQKAKPTAKPTEPSAKPAAKPSAKTAAKRKSGAGKSSRQAPSRSIAAMEQDLKLASAQAAISQAETKLVQTAHANADQVWNEAKARSNEFPSPAATFNVKEAFTLYRDTKKKAVASQTSARLLKDHQDPSKATESTTNKDGDVESDLSDLTSSENEEDLDVLGKELAATIEEVHQIDTSMPDDESFQSPRVKQSRHAISDHEAVAGSPKSQPSARPDREEEHRQSISLAEGVVTDNVVRLDGLADASNQSDQDKASPLMPMSLEGLQPTQDHDHDTQQDPAQPMSPRTDVDHVTSPVPAPGSIADSQADSKTVATPLPPTPQSIAEDLPRSPGSIADSQSQSEPGPAPVICEGVQSSVLGIPTSCPSNPVTLHLSAGPPALPPVPVQDSLVDLQSIAAPLDSPVSPKTARSDFLQAISSEDCPMEDPPHCSRSSSPSNLPPALPFNGVDQDEEDSLTPLPVKRTATDAESSEAEDDDLQPRRRKRLQGDVFYSESEEDELAEEHRPIRKPVRKRSIQVIEISDSEEDDDKPIPKKARLSLAVGGGDTEQDHSPKKPVRQSKRGGKKKQAAARSKAAKKPRKKKVTPPKEELEAVGEDAEADTQGISFVVAAKRRRHLGSPGPEALEPLEEDEDKSEVLTGDSKIDGIRRWLRSCVKGGGPASITAPKSQLGIRTYIYERASNLPEVITTAREIALTAMVSSRHNLICRYHSITDKSARRSQLGVDGDDDTLYGRPWPPLSKAVKDQLLQDQAKAEAAALKAGADPASLKPEGWVIPGWNRVKSRHPRAADCGCDIEDMLLELYLWKTGKLKSYTVNIVDNWRADFLSPRQRALACAQHREWALLEADDMFSLGTEDGRWVQRDEAYPRRIQRERLNDIIAEKERKAADASAKAVATEKAGEAELAAMVPIPVVVGAELLSKAEETI